MRIKIWGCRGSLPAAIKPLQIEEKIARAIHQMPQVNTADWAAVWGYVRGMSPLARGTAGGNTTCVELQTNGTTFVIDAGTGLRELGLELMKGQFGRGEGEIHIFFSHPHWDHIQGFPFFMPAYIPGNRIVIYGVHDMQTALVDQQRYLNFPVPISSMEARLEFVQLEAGRMFEVDGVRIDTIRNAHPGDSYGYRFENGRNTFVFASDAEFKHLDQHATRPHTAFFKEADALIFDAQYTLREGWVKEDWGHSSAMIGVEMALSAGVKRLILFHHDPANDDDDLEGILADARAYCREIGEGVALDILVAYEGMVLDLLPEAAAGARPANNEALPILVPDQIFDEISVQNVAARLPIAGMHPVARSRIIDLTHVETLTTAGLKQLVELQLEDGQPPLVLAAASPSVLRVIELGGFADYFAIYPTVEAAQTAVLARERAQLPGHLLNNRYLIERVLDLGRMGTVLLARDQQVGETRAVRIIDPAYSERARDRLFSQRDQLLAVQHPNLLPIYDLARDEQSAYMIEAYHPGDTVHDLMRVYPHGLTLDRGLQIAQSVVAGIAFAHEKGIVHGNIKSDKIYLDNGSVQVGGLGLGRLEERLNLLEAPMLRQAPVYLAPEQVAGQPIDTRTDIYALGVLFYRIFTGVLPFRGSDRQILRAHLEQAPHPPQELSPRIPAALNDLILRMMAKDPMQRPATAVEVQRQLLSLANTEE